MTSLVASKTYNLIHKISVVWAASVAVLMPQRILLFGSTARPALHKVNVPLDPWPEAPFERIQGPVVGILPSPNWCASTKKQAVKSETPPPPVTGRLTPGFGQLHSSLNGGSDGHGGMDELLMLPPTPPLDTDTPADTDALLRLDTPLDP